MSLSQGLKVKKLTGGIVGKNTGERFCPWGKKVQGWFNEKEREKLGNIQISKGIAWRWSNS